MNIFPLHATDFYKTGHPSMYPEGSEFIYENFTCRSSKFFEGAKVDKVVFFGLQYVMQNLLIDIWNKNFFDRPLGEVKDRYKRRMDLALGEGAVGLSHIHDLWKLGYLPIEIKALPEGSRVDIRVPLFTIANTVSGFAWIVGYLETAISAELWQIITSATTAYEYRKLFDKYAIVTGASKEFVPWQGHDFSARGMVGIIGGAASGMGHLLSFTGTDSIMSLDFLEEYYHGKETFLGGSVPATEHSVMCMGGKETEIQTYDRLLNLYPKGVLSIVSDTWDFWQVLTDYSVTLKDKILARNGKVVFRPDSGDPVKIIVGEAKVLDLDKEGRVKSLGDAKSWAMDWIVEEETDRTGHGLAGADSVNGYFKYDNVIYHIVVQIDWNRYDKQYYYFDGATLKHFDKAVLSPAEKGAVEVLWDIFGGTVNEAGYKELDPHVGLIYGDSISLDRARAILEGLKAKGFASSNIVFGIGSYTYQHVTRDTLGTAIKATWGQINGEAVELEKKPKTDNGVKNSACGLIRIEFEDGKYVMYDRQTPEQEQKGLLTTVFKDGKIVLEHKVADIRKRLLEGM